MAKRPCKIIRARSFNGQPETTWREAVADKTAALEASVQKAMEVNKEAIDKAVGSIKTEVEKAVSGIKTDVGGIKTDMKDALKMEISAVEKVLKAEVSALKDSFRNVERICILAIAVFIFGKPVLGGIKDVLDAAKESVSSTKE